MHNRLMQPLTENENQEHIYAIAIKHADNGRYYYDQGKYAEALKAYEQFYEKYLLLSLECRKTYSKELADELNNFGITHYKLHQHGEAIQYYNQSIELDPNSTGMRYHNLACSHYALRHYLEAISYLNQAINLDSQNEMFYRLRGNAKLYSNQYLACLLDYEKTIDLMTVNNTDSLQNSKDHFSDFIDIVHSTYEKLSLQEKEIIHQLSGKYESLGFNFCQNGSPELSIALYNIALALNPQAASTYICRSLAKRDYLQEYNEVISDTNRAIEIVSTEEDKRILQSYYFIRALHHGLFNHYQEAIKDYDIAIKLKPNDAASYLNRAICKGKLGLKVERILDLEKNLKLRSYSQKNTDKSLKPELKSLSQKEKIKLEKMRLLINDYDLDINQAQCYLNANIGWFTQGMNTSPKLPKYLFDHISSYLIGNTDPHDLSVIKNTIEKRLADKPHQAKENILTKGLHSLQGLFKPKEKSSSKISEKSTYRWQR